MSQYDINSSDQPTSADQTAADLSAAKDKAADAAQTGKQAAGEVAQTATTAVKDVAQETKSQARELAGKTGDQLNEQAGVQKSALVDSLYSLVGQLDAMTGNVDENGIAVEAAGKIRDAARSAADWLDGRDPGEVLDGIRDFGRERPAAYLGGSLVAGLLAGRLTRGVAAAHTDGAKPSHAADPAGARPSYDTGSALSGGPGRHEERYAAPATGLYSDPAIGTRPSPGQTTPGQAL